MTAELTEGKLTLLGWERKEYGFCIPCRYPKAIGKYGFGAGMSVPNNPGIRGIAWYMDMYDKTKSTAVPRYGRTVPGYLSS